MLKYILTITIFLLCLSLEAQVIDEFPYHEPFEVGTGTVDTILPDGWTTQSLGTMSPFNSGWVSFMNITGTGNRGILVPGISGIELNEWIFTPPVVFQPGKYIIQFSYRTGNSFGVPMSFHVGSDAIASAMDSIPLWQVDEINNTTFLTTEISYMADDSTPVHFAFRVAADKGLVTSISQNAVDDFMITEDLSSSVESISKEKLLIMPNPASNYFKIYLNHFSPDLSLIVSDLQGKTVLSQTKISSEARYDVSHLNPGIYLVTLQNQMGRVISSEKISLQR